MEKIADITEVRSTPLLELKNVCFMVMFDNSLHVIASSNAKYFRLYVLTNKTNPREQVWSLDVEPD